VYKEYDGWKKSIVGINNYDDLPDNAKKYIKDIESFLDIPIDIISNGPGREENIILKNIF
jgi:adenylosuccinate synthase